MNKMLPTPTRFKHERDITVLLTTLSEHTTACEKRIAELEKRLKVESDAAASFKRDARKAEQQVQTLRQKLEDGKGEAAALATDLKLARSAHKAAEKEASAAQAAHAATENKLTTLQAEKDAVAAELLAANRAADALRIEIADRDNQLADARSELDSYEVIINEFRDTDQALRERIAYLESQLSDERTKAGKDLLLRIMELETMLEAERHKVNDLQELPSMVKLETRSVAANTNNIKTSRRVSGGKR